MKQVLLSGQGQVDVFDVPLPGRFSGSLLVRSAFSLISTGTEGAAVTSRKGVLGLYEKATASRDRIDQVWKMVQSQGVEKTWKAVRHKLEDYNAIGYSSAGQIAELENEELPFRVGQQVACMGAGFASHAEYVAVPKNLVAPIPKNVSLQQASFGAMACIAIQGIRRLEASPGESIGVIGLGLIGQLAIRLLKAMGYSVFGTDLNSRRTAMASQVPVVQAWTSGEVDSLSRVMDLTGGYGLDGVIVCASTQSDEPVNLAFDICRQRGRVSLVGDVGLGLKRAKLYSKEIELRMSCSYGPGRYDENYERRGEDYPFGYVRWTEKRNLEFFLDLLANGTLDLSDLISETFHIDQAADAYALIKQNNSDVYGVLFDYKLPAEIQNIKKDDRIQRHGAGGASPLKKDGAIRLGLIGVGGYAKNMHIPNLNKLKSQFQIYGLASRSGTAASVAARRVDAEISTSDYENLLEDSQVDAVLISTRHASHGQIVLHSLEAGKHVFVEKPMAIILEEAQAIEKLAAKTGLIVRVGFNRRFSPFMIAMKKAIGPEGRRMLTCRVNIGSINNDWSNTPQEGGRLLGEGVHFFDLCNWFMGSDPISVSSMVAGELECTNPNAMVQLLYPGGSIAHVTFTSLSDNRLGKEYFEAFGNGTTVRVDDFQNIKVSKSSVKVARHDRGDKGQKGVLVEFAAAVRGLEYPNVGADAHAGLLATQIALDVYMNTKD